jgi:hypothetical protein
VPQANSELPPEFTTTTEPHADAFDPVRQMRQSVAAEKLRLQLREIRGAHNELDAREETRRRAASEQQSREAQARLAVEREREVARQQAQRDEQARQRIEESKQQFAAKRREIIQDVKNTVVNQWFGGWDVSAALKAQMLQAVEAALATLPVQELPKAELLQIAQVARDHLHARAKNYQRKAEALANNRQSLQRYGIEYAEQELTNTEGLELATRLRIESIIKLELQEITGQESRVEIKAWVDRVLDDEGLGFADEEDDYET